MDVFKDVHLGIGIALNCLLLYTIRRFTKKSLGAYKQLLTMFAAFDVCLTIMHAVVNPKVVIIDGTFSVVGDYDDRRVISLYSASFTVPFALLVIHFLYRYWSIRYQHLILLFSTKKFIAFLALFPIADFLYWYVLCLQFLRGEEHIKSLLSAEHARRFGHEQIEGWVVIHYWEDAILHRDMLAALMCCDALMLGSFSIAVTLGCLTFFHIQRSETISPQARALQQKLFIAVCAQTLVPTVFVYIPYTCVMNIPLLRLPTLRIDEACTPLTSCFPAWDAGIIISLMRDYRQAQGRDGLNWKFKGGPGWNDMEEETVRSANSMESNLNRGTIHCLH